MREKCIITLPDQKESFDTGIARLKEMGIETFWENSVILSSRNPGVVISQCRDVDYVFAAGEIWNKEVFDACPRVKLIVRMGAGYEGINLRDASEAGVPVSYMPGFNAQSVAEQTVALMLSAARRIPFMDKKMHEGKKKEASLCTSMLSGKTVGLLGCGNIGKRVAHLLNAFNCRILAYDKQQDKDFAEKENVLYTDRETLLREADYVSLHLPVLPETRGIICRKTISLMKKNAIIVNTSRGSIINSEDLAAALKNGDIRGAALDVFEDEGIPNHSPGSQFTSFENVVMTPHVSGSTQETFDAMMEQAIGVVAAFKTGRPMANLLNPDYRRRD